MKKIIEKARVLTEAMPYIRKFKGRTFVVKYGGSAMKIKKYKELFIDDIATLGHVGIKIIIVHGGGDDISALAEKLGKQAVFVDGHRVTDLETLEIVEKVLIGKVNKKIVSDLKAHGLKVIGVSGKDIRLIMASRKKHNNKDIGFVGEVKSINKMLLKTFQNSALVPVIAPIGVDNKGNRYNINADAVAGKTAEAVNADKLIYITDTDGIMINKAYKKSLNAKEIKKYVKDGQIKGGMLPKVYSAMSAVDKGVNKVHIINGTAEHSLLLEIFTNEGIGTEIIK
ncbi:MAG: acetylglutamate kinase [Candidatus Goldiibacteriota bacterium]